jgi:hypothetical protein
MRKKWKMIKMALTEKLKYDMGYTVGSYLDSILSIPTNTIEGIANIRSKISKNQRAKGNNNPIYGLREKLRDKYDTKPGADYIQSMVVSGIPFFFSAVPAAEGTQAAIDYWDPNMPEILQYTINSVSTLTTQMVTGYTTFMANEVRTNKYKYINEDGKLSPKK